MGWADRPMVLLQQGKQVTCYPKGNSMRGIIASGQACKLTPVSSTSIKKGDVVLCRVATSQYLHVVGAVRNNKEYRIENSSGRVNGWVGINAIYGKLIEIDGKAF